MISMQEDVAVHSGDISATIDSAMREVGVVGWDIETDGLNFREDAIRTCQLFVPGYGVEIVQLTPGETPHRLVEALGSERVFKLFHHAMFDLRFMRYQWGARARNVGCTKIVSKIALPDRKEHSLASLSRQFLGHSMDKTQRLSDWGSLELTPEQISYAADDAVVLPDLFEKLWRHAREEGVGDLIERSFDYIPVRVETDIRNCGDVFSY